MPVCQFCVSLVSWPMVVVCAAASAMLLGLASEGGPNAVGRPCVGKMCWQERVFQDSAILRPGRIILTEYGDDDGTANCDEEGRERDALLVPDSGL